MRGDAHLLSPPGKGGACRELRGPASRPVPQIPRSYLSLREAVLAEQQRRSLSDDVQYLTDRQLEQLVEQMPDNDIKDYEDLQSGERGAREQGVAGKGESPPSPLCTCLRMPVQALPVLGAVVMRRHVCTDGIHESWRWAAQSTPAGHQLSTSARVTGRHSGTRDGAAEPSQGPCVLGAWLAS